MNASRSLLIWTLVAGGCTVQQRYLVDAEVFEQVRTLSPVERGCTAIPAQRAEDGQPVWLRVSAIRGESIDSTLDPSGARVGVHTEALNARLTVGSVLAATGLALLAGSVIAFAGGQRQDEFQRCIARGDGACSLQTGAGGLAAGTVLAILGGGHVIAASALIAAGMRRRPQEAPPRLAPAAAAPCAPRVPAFRSPSPVRVAGLDVGRH